MNWMDGFLTQCLEGVPRGDYRDRTEQELRDHLLSLARDLEGAGYAPEETQALAQFRMGDPAELARSCVREWNRRRQARLLPCALMTVCVLLNMGASFSYYFSSGALFVRVYSGTWPFVFAAYLFPALWNGKWGKIRYYSQRLAEVNAITALFCLPVPGLHLTDSSIPWGYGIGFHLFIVVWCLVNCMIMKRIERKEAVR